MARKYGAIDPDAVTSIILEDIWLSKPFLALPQNEPQLRQRVRFRTLSQLRAERRRKAREERYADFGYQEADHVAELEQ